MATGIRFEFRCSQDFLDRITRRADAMSISTASFVKMAVEAALEPLKEGGATGLLPHCEHTTAGWCVDCRE